MGTSNNNSAAHSRRTSQKSGKSIGGQSQGKGTIQPNALNKKLSNQQHMMQNSQSHLQGGGKHSKKNSGVFNIYSTTNHAGSGGQQEDLLPNGQHPHGMSMGHQNQANFSGNQDIYSTQQYYQGATGINQLIGNTQVHATPEYVYNTHHQNQQQQ